MKFRLVKQRDLKQIVNLHYAVRDIYPVGIFAQLGKPFLRQYYRIILNDENEVVICAEDKDGVIRGFSSATLDVEKQFANVRSHKLTLGIAALGSILGKPSLFKSLIARYNSTKEAKGKGKFISASGARLEYWAWSGSYKDPITSLEMHQAHLNILRDLGVKELNFEVDTLNKKIFLFHKFNGAELIDKVILPDGRERALMMYNLVDRKSRL